MASQFGRDRNRRRGKNGRDDRRQNENMPRESFARENTESGRYPPEEYPADSYYQRNDEFRKFTDGKTRSDPNP